MILEALHQVANHRESLSREAAREVMSEILSGGATDAQIAALLVALHMKGETVEEIVGFAEAIRKASAPLVLHAAGLRLSVHADGAEVAAARIDRNLFLRVPRGARGFFYLAFILLSPRSRLPTTTARALR